MSQYWQLIGLMKAYREEPSDKSREALLSFAEEVWRTNPDMTSSSSSMALMVQIGIRMSMGERDFGKELEDELQLQTRISAENRFGKEFVDMIDRLTIEERLSFVDKLSERRERTE